MQLADNVTESAGCSSELFENKLKLGRTTWAVKYWREVRPLVETPTSCDCGSSWHKSRNGFGYWRELCFFFIAVRTNSRAELPKHVLSLVLLPCLKLHNLIFQFLFGLNERRIRLLELKQSRLRGN